MIRSGRHQPLVTALACGVTLFAVLDAGSARAEADKGRQTWLSNGDSVRCTLRAILGESKPGGIDKRLEVLKKQLAQAPFSTYKSLRLLESRDVDISRGGRQQSKLPTGKLLKLQFKEKLLVKGKVRLRMHLSITPPKQKEFLPGTLFTIADGGTLLVAGDSYGGGTLVVGITCQAK